jgi:5'-methylthioadenosine phosphorylase
MARIAVLCGTGMSDLASLTSSMPGAASESAIVESVWGEVPITITSVSNGEVVVIDRHHSGSAKRTPPHAIEHRANVHAAASCLPDLVVSVNSVGTMREDLGPGTIGIAGDVLDLAERPWTFHNDDAFHTDRSSLFDSRAVSVCSTELVARQGGVLSGLIVAQCVGPQFESPSEIDALELMGADVVGMTLGPESRLVAETGLPHLAIICSSNWAAGRTPGFSDAAIDHEAVDSIAGTMMERVGDCLMALLAELCG